MPYLYVLNGPSLMIFSITTNQKVREIDLKKLTKTPVHTITCITHRYILLHSKVNDKTYVLTLDVLGSQSQNNLELQEYQNAVTDLVN